MINPFLTKKSETAPQDATTTASCEYMLVATLAGDETDDSSTLELVKATLDRRGDCLKAVTIATLGNLAIGEDEVNMARCMAYLQHKLEEDTELKLRAAGKAMSYAPKTQFFVGPTDKDMKGTGFNSFLAWLPGDVWGHAPEAWDPATVYGTLFPDMETAEMAALIQNAGNGFWKYRPSAEAWVYRAFVEKKVLTHVDRFNAIKTGRESALRRRGGFMHRNDMHR